MTRPFIHVDQQPESDRLCAAWALPETPEPNFKLEVCEANGREHLRCGEEARFIVRALENGRSVSGCPVELTLNREGSAPQIIKTVIGAPDSSVAATLEAPGNVRLKAVCGETVAQCGVMFEPEKLLPEPEPADFDAFWQKQLQKLAEFPLRELKRTPVPPVLDKYRGKVECFDVQVDCAGRNPVSGLLAKPSGAGRGTLPGYIFFHGAGIFPAFQPLPWAGDGFIALNVNAHGLPNDRPEEYFRYLEENELKSYCSRRVDAPEESLFCTMLLRAVRAVEYLRAQPEWDGKTLILHGGSQGGFQAIAAAALTGKADLVVANAPAMCDLAGFRRQRSWHWPFAERPENFTEAATYFDTASFARRLHCAVLMTAGLADAIATPSSIHAAYNACTGSPREIQDYAECDHARAVFWSSETRIKDFAKDRK